MNINILNKRNSKNNKRSDAYACIQVSRRRQSIFRLASVSNQPTNQPTFSPLLTRGLIATGVVAQLVRQPLAPAAAAAADNGLCLCRPWTGDSADRSNDQSLSSPSTSPDADDSTSCGSPGPRLSFMTLSRPLIIFQGSLSANKLLLHSFQSGGAGCLLEKPLDPAGGADAGRLLDKLHGALRGRKRVWVLRAPSLSMVIRSVGKSRW